MSIALQQAVEVSILQQTIAQLRSDKKLLGYAALLATMRVTEGPCGTAMTDTLTFVQVDPDFMAQLTRSMRQFVLVHETWHKWQNFFPRFEVWAKRHPGLERNKLFAILNQAGDYLINYQLHNAVGLELPVWTIEGLPQKVLYNPSYTQHTHTMEQLGDLLLRQEQDKPGEGGAPEPGSGGLDKGGDVALPDMYNGDIKTKPNEGQIKEIEALTRRDLANAAKAAKVAGDESGFGDLMADESKKDKHNWMQVLYKWASKVRPGGMLTYARPNRRYKIAGGRVQMPSRRQKVLGNVAIVMDTSGSTMTTLMGQVMAEVKAVLRNVKFEKLYVLHVDTQVRKCLEFKPGELHKWTPEMWGGGGTRFSPAFAHMLRELPKMAAIVYHTDGYCSAEDISRCEDMWIHMGRPAMIWALNDMDTDQFKQRCSFGTMMDCK